MISNQEPLEFTDKRLTDYDVILARSDVDVKGVDTGNYISKLSIPSLGIEVKRGYVKCRVKINGRNYLFVNTHLESADYGGESLVVQMSQTRELISMLDQVRIPIIIAGDFNSEAETGNSYQIITNRKFVDVWIDNEYTNNPLGYTYGHDSDLRNISQSFSQRIDYIFVKKPKTKTKEVYFTICKS